MSRIGDQPIKLPSGVDLKVDDGVVTVKGSKGTLTQAVHPSIKITREGNDVQVVRSSDENEDKALHGLMRSLVANMVTGVSTGFSKSLELVGVGYRAQQAGKNVTLSVMMSHPVEVKPLDGVTLEVEGANRIHVRGMDKQAVGQMAANIKAIRRPNAYTGKGIRYLGEQIRLKAGKSARRTA